MENTSTFNSKPQQYISYESDKLDTKKLSYFNMFADYFFYTFGVPVLPKIKGTKRPNGEWGLYTKHGVSVEQHEKWKKEGAYENGFMLIPGNVYRGQYKGKYFVALDCDSSISFEYIKKLLKEKYSQVNDYFIIEQHRDNLQKAHFYLFSEIPFPKKIKDKVIELEIACEGNDKLMCSSPGPHPGGFAYEFEDMDNKARNNWLPKNLDKQQSEDLLRSIQHYCKENGVSYSISLLPLNNNILENLNGRENVAEVKHLLPNKVYQFIKTLDFESFSYEDPENKIMQGFRHPSLLTIANILISTHLYTKNRTKDENSLKKIFDEINDKLCLPPSPLYERNKIWEDTLEYQKSKHEDSIETQLEILPKSKNSKNEKNQEESELLYQISKYTKDKKIHESIIINKVPVFIAFNELTQDIDFTFRINNTKKEIFTPIEKTKIGYIAYEFENKEELNRLFNKAKNMNIFDIFNGLYEILENYTNNDFHRLLVTLLIVFSYFQDKFASTPYLYIFGDNDTGKTNLGSMISALAYRCCLDINPSTASIYRTLGKFEEGQGTFVFDEIDDKIRSEGALRDILKSGYKKGAKVSRCDTNNNNDVDKFNTFGFKVLISETLPEEKYSKGILDRAFVVQTTPQEISSKSLYDMYEVMYTEGINKKLEELKNDILSFRKVLLLFKAIHFQDNLSEVKIYGDNMVNAKNGVNNSNHDQYPPQGDIETLIEENQLRNRHRELIKPLFQIFTSDIELLNEISYRNIIDKIKQLSNNLISNKFSYKNQNLLENDLLKVIKPIVKSSRSDSSIIDIPFNMLWVEISNSMEGIPNKNNFNSADHGEITQLQVTKILTNRFNFEKKKKSDGSHYLCSEREFENLLNKYEVKGENYLHVAKVLIENETHKKIV